MAIKSNLTSRLPVHAARRQSVQQVSASSALYQPLGSPPADHPPPPPPAADGEQPGAPVASRAAPPPPRGLPPPRVHVDPRTKLRTSAALAAAGGALALEPRPLDDLLV